MGIEIRNLQAAYERSIIIPCANLTIPKQKITMLIGKNGCGKSTLLKTMARILLPRKGEVLLDGVNIRKLSQKALARKMAVLPQSPLVPEGIQVRDLVAYGRFPYRRPMSGQTAEDREVIDWAMEKTGVYPLREQKVEELSGGQRQRVWISLALAQKTSLLLLDEPTTYLDMAHQLEILELLQTLNREEQTTIVMVIHELNHASKFADHIVGIREGNILFEGAPQDVIQVENLRRLYEIEAVLERNHTRGYPICTDYSLIYGH